YRASSRRSVCRDEQLDEGVWLEWSALWLDLCRTGIGETNVAAQRSLRRNAGSHRRTLERHRTRSDRGDRHALESVDGSKARVAECVSRHPRRSGNCTSAIRHRDVSTAKERRNYGKIVSVVT